MKPEEISEAVGMIDDDIINSANASRGRNKRRKNLWMRCIAAAACVCIIFVGVFGRLNMKMNNADPAVTTGSSQTKAENNGATTLPVVLPTASFAIAKAEYPKMAQFPKESAYYNSKGVFDYDSYSAAYNKWCNEQRKRRDSISKEYASGIKGFYISATEAFLSSDGKDNLIYSPLNMYMALSMLAEVTDAESRRQILNLLGVQSLTELRKEATALWNSNYCNDGATTSILANSVWLKKNISYNKATMNNLTKYYWASSFSGEMGSDAYNKAIQDWLNEQTGGLLKEQAKEVEFNTEMIMSLASTIYFKAKWQSEFNESNTKKDIFHSAVGDITCDFMNMDSIMSCYRGDSFTAISLNLENSGGMWLILPDEGISVESLTKNKSIADLVMNTSEWNDSKRYDVNLSVPKFDVSSSFDMKKGLKELNVVDVFNSEKADFSPMTDSANNISLSSAIHAARVQIDEKGCIATAFTVLTAESSAAPLTEKIDFIVNRPFMFVITSETNSPLFAGVVNQP